MDKKDLIKILQKKPNKYWYLDFFKETGFKRKKCRNCGKFFWTQTEQELCNDSSCRPYEFIGNPLTKNEHDFFSMWKKIKNFFEEQNHKIHPRYPVLSRWFSDLNFTIAGVVDFYRKDGSDFVFELPANPVVILQPSLRFNDIPQVGVSGRHWTCHTHLEQASLADEKNGYWKEKCIELDYRMLTEVMGIKKDKINFIEDAWLGPGAFGYSLEYHVGGLELGNAVFTEFKGNPQNYKVMDNRLIDMGAGFDRFVWISQGTPTNYDAVLGKVLDKMKKKSGVYYDKKLFEKYSKLAGVLNLDENLDIEKEKTKIANSLGVEKNYMIEKIEPIQALYAVADHAKALLYAISDGGIPSNIGGGYNLRVILRRALSFIENYNLSIDIEWVAKEIANYFKPVHPELKEKLEHFNNVMEVEKRKYRESSKNTKKILNKMIVRKEKITEEKMIELYDSRGITPENLKEAARKQNVKIDVPSNIYQKVTEKHEKEKKTEKKYPIDEKEVEKIGETPVLFYEDVYEFEAKVLKVIDDFVVLDKTGFYPRSGGQETDIGFIEDKEVHNVEKVNKTIIHQVKNPDFKAGQTVRCKIDKKRRRQLMQHHTTTHIINTAATIVLGKHVWQGGSKKDVNKAHLDISHYKNLSERELLEIEKKANELVKKNYKIKKEVLERPEAEKKYGFRIYQGAAVPSKTLRIISIDDLEHEACGGTHLNTTKEAGKILILKTEKPHDGIVRITYVSGESAERYLKKCEKIIKKLEKILETKEDNIVKESKKLISKWKENRKKIDKLREEVAKKKTEKMNFEKIKNYNLLIKEFKNTDRKELQKISMEITDKDTIIFLFGLNKKIDIFASAGKDVKENIGKIVKEVSQILGGRGGGSPKLGQGFGTNKNKMKEAKKKIREMIK